MGTCGFAYKDWVGPFYAPKTKPVEMLVHYARAFRAVEIDSSYYAVPGPRSVASMVARTPPGFRFSFKAPQSVTHPPDSASLNVHADAKRLLESLEPARSAGKLACVLLQFPNAFRPEGNRETYVQRAVESFEGAPVVVEFRNAQWQRPQTLAMLAENGAGYCNVDMPHLEGLLHPSADVTGPVGYVRFHGRNAKTWWRGTNVTRYDYLYSADELEPWADRIAEVEERARETYVFFNNHANGKSARNAEMMQALLEDRYGASADEAVARAEGGLPEQAAFEFNDS
ncbi:MAG: DUF72 domain-containing protein [Candidatus Eremiobacteraeota bacterium]|nr:DUF72 domain-containing protein [Candidatus Eremiobacteraeota bacterium]